MISSDTGRTVPAWDSFFLFFTLFVPNGTPGGTRSMLLLAQPRSGAALSLLRLLLTHVPAAPMGKRDASFLLFTEYLTG